MPYSEAFQQAEKIVGMEPLPDDALEQLEKLESQLSSDTEKELFGDQWEAFIVAGGEPEIIL